MAIQIVSSYLCYVFAKFACKIKIQEFSFSLPLCLAAPMSLIFTIWLGHILETDKCLVNNFLPDYLVLHGMKDYDITSSILKEFSWLWILWWLSQLWTTRHIWNPSNDKNAPTEKLFVCPWYCGLLIDQCVTMNRRIVDWNDEYLSMKVCTYMI